MRYGKPTMNVKEKEEENEKRTYKDFSHAIDTINNSVLLAQEILPHFSKLNSWGQKSNVFLSVSNINSIVCCRNLIAQGYYHQAYMVMRHIYESNFLMLYFMKKEDEAKAWAEAVPKDGQSMDEQLPYEKKIKVRDIVNFVKDEYTLKADWYIMYSRLSRYVHARYIGMGSYMKVRKYPNDWSLMNTVPQLYAYSIARACLIHFMQVVQFFMRAMSEAYRDFINREKFQRQVDSNYSVIVKLKSKESDD